MGFFTNKWLIQSLALLALALLVWFAGPYIGFDGVPPLAAPWVRGLTIAALVLVWGIWHLVRLAWAGHKDRELFNKLNSADPSKTASHQEATEKLEVLRGGFEAAVQVLRESRTKDKGSKQCLYELPWYVIIGAPGTGKTTALVNAGLKFPVASRTDKNPQPVKGVGGTRNCDWWFADEAVLLDTAGRYVTQDSHQEVDEKEWQGFLDLLKEYRPKRPLNGILVASSLADLLEQTEEQRQRHAEVLRRRVLELHRALGVRVPIYMLFTKVDLVAGFNEFFADFSPEERKQVWGETFPADDPANPQDWLGVFAAAYGELLSRLDLHTYKSIQEERNLQRRGLILGFPQQMALLKPAILTFLEAVFAANRYEKPPLLLRGVYFTCGTQEGNPIDRLMGILAQAFRLERRPRSMFSGQGRSFFLNRLLKGVMFPEANLAGVDSRIERLERLLQWGVWGAALALTLGLGGLWWLSYGKNQSAIAGTDAQIQLYHEVTAVPANTRDNFRLLHLKLDALLQARELWLETGWAAHFGLYQGDKLGAAAGEAYERLLRVYFLPAIAVRLQERLQAKANIELLKTYRMFGKMDWERFDPKTVEAVVVADWEQLFNTDPNALASLTIHLKNLLQLKQLSKLEPVALDESIKAQAVNQLTQVSADQRCYDSFKVLKSTDHTHGFKLAEALKPNGQKTFMVADGRDINIAVVPSLFTAWGYKEFVLVKSLGFIQDCMADNWALDVPSSAADPREVHRLHEQFMSLYLGEYRGYWWSLVNGIKPHPAQTRRQTIDLLDMLSRPDSPLRLLLVAVENNTALSKASASVAEAATRANLLPDGQTRERIKAVQAVAGLNASGTGDPLAWMERSFAELNALVRVGSDKSAPLDIALDRAKDLGNYFRQSSSGEQAQRNAAGLIGGGDVVEQAKMEFARLPEPVRGWLLLLTTGGVGETLSEAKGGLSDKAKSAGIAGAGSPCRAKFAGRYPFVRGGQDAPLLDFAAFFKPGGVMDQFFQENLKDFVDTASTQWRQKSNDGQSLGLSADAIHQFQSAAKIRDAFFPAGGQSPQAQFDMRLVELSSGADNVHFVNEGQDIAYRSGQAQADRVQWPGPKPGTGVQVVFETPEKQQASLSKSGPWALFRLLDESRIGGGERFGANFQAGGFTARFEVQALSTNNPFNLGDSRNFHCPESL